MSTKYKRKCCSQNANKNVHEMRTFLFTNCEQKSQNANKNPCSQNVNRKCSQNANTSVNKL